jgi:flagellin
MEGALMSFRITTNTAALAAQRYLSRSQRQAEKSLMALASGSRVTMAGDDAAGFAIAEGLRGQLGGIRQAKFNAESAQSMIQTAEGGLNEQNNILIRMRELAVYSASDTVGDVERAYLNTEFEQLGLEFERIAQSTRFGNKMMLTGSGEDFTFQVGAFKGSENSIEFKLDADTTAGAAGISGLAIADKSDALDSLAELDSAVDKVSGVRATFGALQSRLQYASDNLAVQAENIAAARSQIVDVDIAEEVTKLSAANVVQAAGIAVLAQANIQMERAVQLIG